MNTKEHWDSIYGRKTPDQLSWYQPHLDRSLDLIRQAGVPRDSVIIDVGGGSSTLVDDLLARAHTDVTVLDVRIRHDRGAQDALGQRAAVRLLLLPPRDGEEVIEGRCLISRALVSGPPAPRAR